MAITTIRVVRRTNMFVAKGTVLKSVSMGEMRARCKPKLSIIAISTIGAKRSKMVRGVRGRMH